MKLTMADTTSPKNNWAGRLQIQLALISSEFFSFPYKFETTAEIKFLIEFMFFLYLTWWKFQMKFLIIDDFVFYTTQALYGDSDFIFRYLNFNYTAEVISNLALKWVLLIRRKSVHMLTLSLNELNLLNISSSSVLKYWAYSAWRSLIVGVSETQSFLYLKCLIFSESF